MAADGTSDVRGLDADTGAVVVTSPRGTTRFEVSLDPTGQLIMCALSSGRELIRLTNVGLRARLGGTLIGPFDVLVELERSQVVDEFHLPTGKARRSTLDATRVLLAATQAGRDRQLLIEIRVSDNAAAYRLTLAATDAESDVDEILEEATHLEMPSGTVAWLQDHDRVSKVAPAYEGWHSNRVPVDELEPTNAGWTLPALFECAGRWLLLAESAVDSTTGGSHMNVAVRGGPFRIRPPHDDEGDPAHGATIEGDLPLSTPWRAAIMGSLNDVVSSNVVRHLNPSGSSAADYSWARPGRVAWSWWSDHDSPKNPIALRSSIDVASNLGWEYALVDANWNHLPPGTVADLVEYARPKGVKLMLWYNSGGPNNVMDEQPRDLMTDPTVRRAELARIAALGVVGIKIDFFHSDKPQGIDQFHGILADAAAVQLMVNFHGCTAPRGWSRTFPNLMTTEGVRGAEWYRLSDDYGLRAPANNTILPFTRNVVGSMDYTPVVLSDLAQNRMTTNGHELALAVVFESGLVHFCDAPLHYAAQPAPVRTFLSSVPAAWDDVHLLDGYPGSHVVVARRAGPSWFVGGLNGRDEPLATVVDLTSLGVNPGERFELLTCSPEDPGDVVHTSATAAEIAGSSTVLNPFGGWVIWPSDDGQP